MDWIELLEDATGRFAATVAAPADASAPVASCPGWSVADLVAHLGEVHQWSAHAVLAGTPDGVAGPGPTGPDLAQWYAGHAAHLLDVLRDAGPDGPAWTFGPGPHVASWWGRRQVHETTVHTWDAESALGTPSPIDPVLAWDGVDEVATMFYPRQVRLGRTTALPGRLRLIPTDLDVDPIELGEGEAVQVTGTAEELLLLLWQRHRVDDDRATALLAHPITP